jgi:hypothetical protein
MNQHMEHRMIADFLCGLSPADRPIGNRVEGLHLQVSAPCRADQKKAPPEAGLVLPITGAPRFESGA